MKCSPYVSLLVVTILAIAWEARTQTPALQKGVSVQMASTTGAAQLADADNPDAWIVTVTANGDLYFGVDPVTPENLLEMMKSLWPQAFMAASSSDVPGKQTVCRQPSVS